MSVAYVAGGDTSRERVAEKQVLEHVAPIRGGTRLRVSSTQTPDIDTNAGFFELAVTIY